MNDWYTTLDGLRDGVWQRLSRGVADASAPARHPTLATVGLQGGPEVRTVVLRAADRASGAVQVHTDTGSAKVAELRKTPLAALHVWDHTAHLQIRLRGTVDIGTGDQVAHLWSRVPDGSRASYGVTPAPGTPIPASDAYQRIPDAGRFAVLTMSIAQIDVVHLSGDYHRRAVFTRQDGWHGGWRAP
jgi:hypothetical protein